MLNYHAKYTIAKCSFHPDADYYIDRQTAYVGVLTLTGQGMYQTNLSALDTRISLGGAVSIDSRLGGGIGFPIRDRALEIFSNDHIELMHAFINTIEQENIVFFDDGERYAPLVMEILLDLAKNSGKRVTCISVLPVKYEGRIRRRKFHISWSEIEKNAEDTILYDFDFLEEGQNSISEIKKLRDNKLFNTIAQLWKETKKYDR